MDVLNSVVDKLEQPKLKPLEYIRKSASKSSDTLILLRNVFNLMLNRPGIVSCQKDETLKEIFVENFEAEQIWQQIELKNNFLNSYVPSITKLLLSKKDVRFPYFKKTELDSISEKVFKSNSEHSETDKESESGSSVSDNEKNLDLLEGEDLGIKNAKIMVPEFPETLPLVSEKLSSTRDLFFNLDKMESYLDQAEKESFNVDDNIDYFTDLATDDETAESQPMYKDFFDDPEIERQTNIEDDEASMFSDDVELEKSNKSKKRIMKSTENLNESKKVRFMSEDESSDDDSEISDINMKSSFEKKNLKLKEQINKMEEIALGEKPWPQRGEVDAQQRPHNSLLEEVVDIDLTNRPAPVMTEKVTYDLETIIMSRIKDRAFDDVERKIKPVHVQHELKKELVLNQEKSKLSLAQIYEQEYLSKQDAVNEHETQESNEMTEQKEEILRMMKSLFMKLDTLSNFHYTPKPVIDELKIISNTPAIALEEPLPIAVSETTTLAPQEIARSKKKVLIGKDERTKTDKHRERRKKKAFLAKKMKSKNISNPLNKILKSKKVSLVEPASGKEKAIKTSKKFFNELQDNAEAGFLSKKPKEKARKVRPHK